MAECGNMPDWHPYNPPSGGRPAPPSGAQNSSTGHMFISSISPPALDGGNLTSERHQTGKHQNEASYVGRTYAGGPIAGGNCATSSSLPSGVHMTPLAGCVNHYGGSSSTRNPMMDTLGGTIDPRMVPVGGINEDIGHRNGQIAFSGPTNHPSSSNLNVNAGPTTMQNSPVGPMSPGRQAGYGACKAPCCHPDASITYQHWDKYGHYHGALNAPSSYRENIRQSAYPPVDNRRYIPDMNLRKECLDKDLVDATPFPVEHRRNYDYKYSRKDSVLSRNYAAPANGMLQNYPMQNYNFPNEYQKCPYSVKDYMRRGNSGGSVSSKNSAMLKYQEQQSVIVQQKYSHSKQMQYQNGGGGGGVLPSTSSSGNLPSSLQNSYYNTAQTPRDLSRDYSRDYSQEQAPNRMPQAPSSSHVHGSFSKYHAYHQKIAMQRYSMENHLRSYSRIPGYQSHPKYQECVMRYRELLRLQQTVDYQNVLQEAPKVPSPSNAAPPVAPINLQFDQNGILINSNYIPGNYTGIHGGVNPTAPSESNDSSANNRMSASGTNMERQNQFMDHNDQSLNLTRDLDSQVHQSAVTSIHENTDRYFVPGEKNDNAGSYNVERLGTSESLDTPNVDVDGVEATKAAEENVTGAATTTAGASMPSVTTTSTIEYNNSKHFADKPELDVRQFLANWDESEDEDTAATNVVATSLNEQFEGAVFSSKSPATGAVSEDATNSTNERNSQEDKGESSVATNERGSSPLTESTSEIEIETNENSPIDDCESVTIPNEIRCIRTDDGDDIPTIHIVDNLEAGTDLEKIHTVFGSLASSVLNPISIDEASSEIIGEDGSKGETIVLFEQENGVCTKTLKFSVSSEGTSSDVVEGVIASIIESSSVETSGQEIVPSEKSPYKSPEAADSSSDQLLAVEERAATSVSSASTTSTASSSCSSKTNTETVDIANLRKQNSFTSEESHNPDDISLPDLQTSECTPISTTLNTPIHSDSEESSEHVSDLTTSTNPIEIIQNSPIISFTHSPIKIEPYEQLDGRMGRPARQRAAEQLERHNSLDFDFDREVACGENTKYTETSETSETCGVEGLETEVTRTEDSMLLADIRESTEQNSYNEKSPIETEREDEFYRTADPLVGMAHMSTTGAKDCSDDAEEACPKENRNDENGVSNCDSPVDRILRSDELDTDKCPSMMEREDDFNRSSDLEKLCDMSLDGSCMMPMISGDDCDEPRIPVQPIESNDCFMKILSDALPVGIIDDSESSDEDNLGKPDEDMWGDVRYVDKHLDANFTSSVGQREKNESRESKKVAKAPKLTTRNEKSSPTESKHHCDEKIDDTSQNEVTYGPCNLSESEAEERAPSPEPSRETVSSENSQRDKSFSTSSIESQKSSSKERKFDDYLGPEETRKNRDTCKRRYSREAKDSEENSRTTVESEDDARSPLTKSYTTKHRDSNVEIQVANFNVKIHDNEVIRNETVGPKATNHDESSDGGLDAIEIKINLSRGDVNRRSNKINSLQDKFTDDDRRISQESDTRESSPQTRESTSCTSGKKCCRKRRRSMPDGFESKKTKKMDDDRTEVTDHYTPKKISRCRNSGGAARHKTRRSMDDELLLNPERSRKESAAEERNFHLEMAKAFNLPWPRDETPETGDSSTSMLTKEDESKRDKKSSTRCKGDSRSEKRGKDVRTLPSPSYNSAMENSSTLDFDNFDVAPNHSSDTDPEKVDSSKETRYGRIKRTRLEDRDRYRNPSSYGTSFDELSSLDAFEINLNTVPIYTTKDGRVTYSPNRNYTYRALIMEARQREGYPALRKLHYPRHLSRNHYREAALRKIYKKRQEERTTHDKKRRGAEYHGGKFKRPASTRHHVEETEARLAMRPKKHENRRREARIPSELEYCSDDQTRGYVDDCLTNKNRSVETIAASYNPDAHVKIIQQHDESPATRRSENTRKDDQPDNSRNSIHQISSISNFKANSVMKNVMEETLRSPKHYPSRENENCLVSKIFQGQELEISARKVSAACPERVQNEREACERRSRFFQDSSHSLKTPMASPLINLEKRPIGWDLEQDCQTALSDSGLESSTTYVEASKESRRIQRWKNSFINKVETAKKIYDTPNDGYTEAIDLSHEKLQTDKNLRYFDDEPNDLRIKDDEPNDLRIKDDENNESRREVAASEIFVAEPPHTFEIEESKKTSESIERSVDTERKRIDAEATLSAEPLDDDALKNDRMSEIVKSLDLAITHRHRSTLKETKINLDREIAKPIKIDNDRETAKPATSIFLRDRESTNRVTRKVSETLSRRASSDGVESRESRNDFFRGPTISEIAASQSEIIREEIEEPVFFNDERLVEGPENLDSRTAMSETIERASTPDNFQARCKDFLIDTSTSFSSCMKLPELVSALPTESESSRLEDTSTRFASESMDFKVVGEDSNSLRSDFMPFTSHGTMNSSVMDNDTSRRDSFFCSVAENAMNAGEDSTIGRNSVDSLVKYAASDCRSEQSPGEAPILSFSGQIQNDTRNSDSPSKSPPRLSCENSIPKLVIKKSEGASRSSSVTQPIDTSTNSSAKDSEKNIQRIEQEMSAHPKIPKMIIRNVRSRPGTPIAVEEEEEEDETEEAKDSLLEQRVFEVEIKLDKDTSQRDTVAECRVPKMKIKLEDKQQPRMILDTPKAVSLEGGGEQSKNVPKVKIRKIRRSSTSRSPIRAGKLSRQSSESETPVEFPGNPEISNSVSSYKFTLVEESSSKPHQSSRIEKIDDESRHDRIPKLTIKKQDVGVISSGYSSSQSLKKRRSRSPGESGSKKQRKSTSKHSYGKKDETRSRERRTNSLDSNDGTTDSQSLSEKIPKVIIKRTSPSAEFKCELSKVGREVIRKDCKWQPEVKLQRSWVLDCMAKEPGGGKLALKMLETSNEHGEKKRSEGSSRKNGEWKRSSSDLASRTASTAFEGKVRRRSVCDLNEDQARYNDDQRPRTLLIGNNRSKSFDENMNANRGVSPRKLKCSSAASDTPLASTKDNNHRTDETVKNYDFEVTNVTESNAERDEETDEKQDRSEMNSKKIKKSDKNGATFEEPESSVIKLDSSDESQTTIEILPASPDNSQPESLDIPEQSSEVEQCIGDGSMGKLYSDEAIPTQFELELDIVDNSTMDSLDVPIPLPGESSLEDDTTSTGEHNNKLEHFKTYPATEDDENVATDMGCEKFFYEKDTKSISLRKSQKSRDTDTKNVCCSDSLVKEVLAAKETLKRCLTKSKSVVVRTKLKPRTKTAAEKKQGSGFDFVGLAAYAKTSKCNVEERAVFHDTVKGSKSNEADGCCSDNKTKSENRHSDRRESKEEKRSRESSEKHDRHRKSWSSESRQSGRSKDEHISLSTSSKSSKRSSLPSTNVGPTKTSSSTSSSKSIEHESFGENSRSKSLSEKSSTNRSFKSNEKTSDRQGSASKVANIEESDKKMKSYKIPKISRSRERSGSEVAAAVAEDKRKSPSPVKMPVLEPQTDLNFELAGSDRDTSRSPPVITKQEEPEIDNEVPKKIEDNVNSDKLDSITKQQDSETVTFADIVSQLAYHEKATIRHRRYCNLCERWFPSTIRHERHLSGYQHRHTELTQRRTVHALFMLFTGKPCPRLLPASIVRTDCSPGEPTPLQIAVQDVAISLEDGARVKPKKDVSSKDE